MGRYYSGDIEGKFWFGVQDSNDADFFGVEGQEPNYLEYYFDTSNLPDIEKGIAKCKKALGKYEKEINDFFKLNEAYTDEVLAKHLKVKKEKVQSLLEWLARLDLGKKILKCVKENGECNFEAEL